MKTPSTPHYDIFFHGVSKGYESTGNDPNLERFYTHEENTVEVVFLVEIRKLDNTPYCYYNYLVKKDVISAIDRKDSYFGIALRLNMYYKNALRIYRILDFAFNEYVLGTLLKRENSKLKYTVPSLRCEATDKIRKQVEALFERSLQAENFAPLSSFPTATGEQEPRLNLHECSEEMLSNFLSKYGCISISPYYPSKAESDIRNKCQLEIRQIKEQSQQAAQQQKKELEDYKRKLDAELQAERSSSAKSKQEIRKKDETISHLQEKLGQIAAIVESIGSNLNPQSRKPFPQPEDNPFDKESGKKRFRHRLILIAIAFLMGFASAIVILHVCNNPDITREKTQENNETSVLKSTLTHAGSYPFILPRREEKASLPRFRH